jgi:hypothetical protein
VCYNYWQLQQIVKKFLPVADELPLECHFAYREAISIIQAILLTKQHSISCVASSLYFMSAEFAFFKEEEIKKIVDDLFISSEASLGNKEQIRVAIYDLYLDFMKKHRARNNADSSCLLLDFLHHCPENMPLFEKS